MNTEKEVKDVPYISHEADMARQERTIKRLWIALMFSILLWAATVGAVLYYEAQFEDVVTETIETSTEGGGNAYGSILSGDNNEVYYGESKNQQN